MKLLFGGFPYGGAQSDVSATAEVRLYNRSPRLACLPGVGIWMKNLPQKSGGCINNLQGDCGCVIGFANRPSVDIYNRSSAVDVCAWRHGVGKPTPCQRMKLLFGGFHRRHLRSLCLNKKKLPDSLIAAAQCTNYSLVLPWHFKLKDKQIETL